MRFRKAGFSLKQGNEPDIMKVSESVIDCKNRGVQDGQSSRKLSGISDL